MKKFAAVFLLALFILRMISCGEKEENQYLELISNIDVKSVHVTYYEGSPRMAHDWELTQEKIDDWKGWLNERSIVQTFEKGDAPEFYDENGPQYVFDVNNQEKRIEYFEFGTEDAYLCINSTWYRIDNPKEPFNRY